MSSSPTLVDTTRSEWLKFRTVRASLIGVLTFLVLTVGLAVLVSFIIKANWNHRDPARQLVFDPVATSLVGVFFGQFAAGVMGAKGILQGTDHLDLDRVRTRMELSGDIAFIGGRNQVARHGSIDRHARHAAVPGGGLDPVLAFDGFDLELLPVDHARTIEGVALFIPTAQLQGGGRMKRKTFLRRFDGEIAQDVRRLDFVEDREGTRLERHHVLAEAGSAGEADHPEGLVQPPGVFGGSHWFAIARDGVEVGALDHEGERSRYRLFHRELVTHLETALGRERFDQELVFELHRVVPGVARQAVFLKGELRGLVEIEIGARLASGADIHIVQHQQIGFPAANRGGRGRQRHHRAGVGGRGRFQGLLTQPKQQAARGRQLELGLHPFGPASEGIGPGVARV